VSKEAAGWLGKRESQLNERENSETREWDAERLFEYKVSERQRPDPGRGVRAFFWGESEEEERPIVRNATSGFEQDLVGRERGDPRGKSGEGNRGNPG